MWDRRQILGARFGLSLVMFALLTSVGRGDDVIESIREYFEGPDEPLTMKQVACRIDCIDKDLFKKGTIGIKSPDVWGQNRMTAYRAEFEGQMAQQLGQFQLILQAAQRRSDVAVLTNATQLSATVAAAGVAAPRGLGGGSRPSAVVVPTVVPTGTSATTPAPAVTVNNSMAGTPSGAGGSGAASSSAPASGGASSSASGSSSGSTDPTSLLSDISQKLNALQASVLPLPSNISNFATATGQPGVGIEPTIQLDEQANYINHLHQIRRINGGDDLTDMAGYGLYLLRLPVSLVPGPESRKGKGAIVTMEARHELTDDLLPNTFRDAVIMDLTFALTQVINEEIHKLLCLHCAPGSLEAAGTPVAMGGAVTRASFVQQGENQPAAPVPNPPARTGPLPPRARSRWISKGPIRSAAPGPLPPARRSRWISKGPISSPLFQRP